MSCQINLQRLPVRVVDEVMTPENVPLSSTFPKSTSALWDTSHTGDALSLHLCYYRNPRLLLSEKTLRLAHRHARQSNKPKFSCFFVGSIVVDADEEGVTVTLDRFDPGRDQPGTPERVPSALVPGDVLVSCVFVTQREMDPDAAVQSVADLQASFKQDIGSRNPVDLAKLLSIQGQISWSQQADSLSLCLYWTGVTIASTLDMEPIRAIPIIPTALARNLTGLSSLAQPIHSANRRRGFLTMDQTRKLLLLLESDPKASSLPLVGVWLSGLTHITNPQVWAWCLHFLFSASLHDRVLSDRGWFLVVLFSLTHSQAQFYQCQMSNKDTGQHDMDYQLLTGSQTVTLYQHVEVPGEQSLQCELTTEVSNQQRELFRELLDQNSLLSAPPPARLLSANDQDSGMEDGDLSPRPSPKPHPPAQQQRTVLPSVPELSLLVDTSFIRSNQIGQQNPGSSQSPPCPAQLLHPVPHDRGSLGPSFRNASKKSVPPSGNITKSPSSSSSSPAARWSHDSAYQPRPAPTQTKHLHSTPTPSQRCSCCSSKTHNFTPILPCPSFSPWQAAPTYPAPPVHPFPPPSQLTNSPPQPALPHSGQTLGQWSRESTPHRSGSCSCPSYQAQPQLPTHRTNIPGPPSSTCLKPCCQDWVRGVLPPAAYNILINQDHQLRLLQAQIKMLLEAQGTALPTSQQPDDQTSNPVCQQPDNQTANLACQQPDNGTSIPAGPQLKSTVSIAVETGASLFSPSSPPFHPPYHGFTCSTNPTPQKPGDGAECQDGSPSDLLRAQKMLRSGAVRSPVLGESVTMYEVDQSTSQQDPHKFYEDLLGQVTSRLQASESQENSGGDVSLSTEGSQSSSSQSDSSLKREPWPGGDQRRQQWSGADLVWSAALQQLAVKVDPDSGQLDRTTDSTVEPTSILACINPTVVLPRLSLSQSAEGSLFVGGSMDLSMEANAIALRYLSDTQLSRLSMGTHSSPLRQSASLNPLSPSNMSLATRRYMRKYGLLEEQQEKEEEGLCDDITADETMVRQPLSDALNVKVRKSPLHHCQTSESQSQLIKDLRPKMHLLVQSNPTSSNKENHAVRLPSVGGEGGASQSEDSVGNFLDLSRLRQLPKLF
ncbi:SCL-interrupting locus protein homolog [Lampris incognitus]|uniref:SCL-interrupting locus protein homolog n=1 Tax=Lampris incognitus TaxID=2546036 RepID=UPI0024B58F29|nr:SCL-interrupting locus protein homolog [Lampris incognitus]